MKNCFCGFAAAMALASMACYAQDDGPAAAKGLPIPSVSDAEIVAQMHRSRPAEEAPPDVAPAPHGSPQNAWRYELYQGRWWYWMPGGRWAYYDGRQWKTLPMRQTGSWLAGGDRNSAEAGSSGGRSTHPRRSSVGGLSTYGGYEPYDSDSSRTISGGAVGGAASSGLDGSLGGSPGAIHGDSPLGASTLPSRVRGTSRLGNLGVGTGGGGLGVSGAGGSLSGGAGGSLGGGAGGSQFGLRSSGDAGSGVGGGSVGGTSVTGGAGAPVR